MKKIIDKSALIICCCTFLPGISSLILPVISLLTVIIVSALSQYCGKNNLSLAVQAIYVFLCMFDHSFLFFLPVILYDFISCDRYYLYVASAVAFLANIPNLSILQITMLIAFSFVAVILQRRCSALEKLEKRFIITRDSSAELTMLLSQKNKQLSENLDYEVHLATLKERNRIAREIHDNVGHMLSRSLLQVGAMLITNNDTSQSEQLKSLNETLNNAMTTIRQSVHNLYDESIDLKQSIIEAIKPLEEKINSVDYDLDFSKNIPNNIKLCFISIIKEAISNIIHHSNADKARIVLREHPAFYQLMIEDNGSNNKKNGNGIGLANMRDRIESMNGIIQITSDKKSFRIFISLKKGNEVD